MTLPLIPAPTTVTTSDGTLTVADGFGVTAQATELSDLASRFIDDVRLDAGISLAPDSPGMTLLLSRDGLDDLAPAAGLRADGNDAADERHGLQITPDGIRVWGPTAEAVHRGLTSLRQLIAAHAADGSATIPTVRITDGPRFAWRGLSLDVVRTFHGPDVVRRVLDMCSLYKLNVLHLHLTDDQGWRFEVPSRPALTEVGATGALEDRPGGYYSRSDVAELVQYAADRFVTLVPEIDMPGHTTVVFRAYPDLAPPEIRTVDLGNGTTLQLSTLDPGREETWTFVEDVLDAVIPQFPQSAYIHIGGDEAWGMSDEAHAAFVERAAALVRARGKRVVGWQETARATVSPDDVVQYWLDMDLDSMDNANAGATVPPEDLLPVLLEHLRKATGDAPKALAQGASLLASPSTWLYFDRPHADSSSDPAQEETRARVGLPFYSPASVRDTVDWDPLGNIPGVQSEAQIAGVEAAIWCETIPTEADLQFMLLPRLPGAAEKGWSRTPTDWADYATRLSRQSAGWDRRGWTWFRSAAVDWA
jgi:hexosaminidase